MKMSRKTRASTSSIISLGLFSVVMLFAVALVPHSVAESEATNAAAEETSASKTITSITPLDDETHLEKTVMTINIPKDNTLPWAFVDGAIENHAEGHPVIVQFFNEESGEKPMHVAQVEVEEDGSYEYMYRVRDVNLKTGEATDIFEGNYTVKIFKVVNSQNNLNTI